MQGFVSINLPLVPTADDLRRAREVMALLNSFGAGAAMLTAKNDDTAAAAAAAFTPAAVVVPPPPGAGDPPPPVPMDSSGLPWDERIHSSAKSTNNDGTWKKKRGVQDSEVTRITAEIRAALGAPAVAAQVVVPPPPAAVVVPPPPAAAGEVTDFASLMTRVGKLQQTGKLTLVEFNTCIMSSGIPADPTGAHNAIGVSKNPAFIPAINALVDATVAGR